MSYLIIGSSSGLGKDLAYQLAKKKNNLILFSRDIRDLKALKSDLQTKYNVNVNIVRLDFSNVKNVKRKLNLKSTLFKKAKGILFPIAQMHNYDSIDLKIEDGVSLLSSNFISITYVISNFLKLKKKGSIIGFGSISSAIGREVNSFYSAGKRALESYFESLMLSRFNKNIYIQFYVLGYLNTNLSFGKKLLLPKGSTKKLSEIVYKNRLKNNKKFYYPFWWSGISLIIKILPFKWIIFFNNFLVNEKNK